MPDDLGRGLTPNELARILRVSPDRVRAWIASGELGAINTSTARCRRPRYIVLAHHLAAWEQSHAAARPAPAPRRRRQIAVRDYYPD
jgi:hypothetical protein